MYDYLPNSDAPYPFVQIGEGNHEDLISNKDVIFGNLSQSIHVWGYVDNRALFEDMSWSIEQSMRSLHATPNYYVKLVDMTSNSVVDTSTHDTLLHAVIEAEFKIY